MTTNYQNDVLDALELMACDICAADRQPVQPEEEVRQLLIQPLHDGVLLDEEEGIKFSDEDYMVELATSRIIKNEKEALLNSPTACFNRLHEIEGTEIGCDNLVSSKVLAKLHNDNEIDAFKYAKDAVRGNVDVFNTIRILAGTIPQLSHGSAPNIYDYFCAIYNRVKNDLAGHLAYNKLPEWLCNKTDIANELKIIHESSPGEDSCSTYCCALQGLIMADFDNGFHDTLKSAKKDNLLIAEPAINTFGVIDYCNGDNYNYLKLVIDLCEDYVNTPNHPKAPIAARTLARLIKMDEDRISKILISASRRHEPEILYMISELVWMNQKELQSREWYWTLFMELANCKSDHIGILRNIDFVLMHITDTTEGQNRIKEFLNSWIANQDVKAFHRSGLSSYFNSTFHKLLKTLDYLYKLITLWLVSENINFGYFAKCTITDLRISEISNIYLHKEVLGSLDDRDIKYLTRHVLGFIYGDDAQISLIFSLAYIDDADKRTFGYINDCFSNVIGYDYPYQTMEFLTAIEDSPDHEDPVKRLASEIRSNIQDYIDKLHALPYLKEYEPDSLKIRQLANIRHKQMNHAFEQANENSIWKQIASTITLKAGRRSFQYIDGQMTGVTELKEISHRSTLPRSEIADPAGTAIERLLYRIVSKDEP